MTPSIPASDAELVQYFESLGDNCEFGLLQRYAGAEPIGLFRFNFTGFPQLLAGIEKRFEDLAAPGNVELTWTDEWMVSETVYKFSYHTFNRKQDYSLERLEREQTRWLRYMAEKFMERLAIGDHIYVRKGEKREQEGQIRLLLAALRKHGPATLLWMTEADAEHQAGTVQDLGDGLICGTVTKFASYLRAPDFDPIERIALLRRVWALHYLKDADAYPAVTQPSVITPGFGGWSGGAAVTSAFAWDVPPLPGGGPVMKHVFLKTMDEEDGIFSNYMTSGLKAGELYVASAYVWLPAGFPGRLDMVFRGHPSLRASNLDHQRTGVWQRVWVSARLPDVSRPIVAQLHGKAPADAVFYSSGWLVQPGGIPAD